WVNVFMGRLNAYVSGNKLGDGRLVGERATLASQKTVRELREALGAPSRQIGASFREEEQVALLAGLDVMTIPTKVAAGFVADRHTPESLSDRTAETYEPVFAEGVDQQLEGFETLWGISDSFRAVCGGLARNLDPASATPEGIRDSLEQAGEGNIFPRLSAEDLGAIAAEGKLPSRERWRERVARGETGLDALFTLAGRFAFAADQAALDARIREHLA
ncbi:MAG: transaldolase family protein, partial [Planctomycetota bacterium]